MNVCLLFPMSWYILVIPTEIFISFVILRLYKRSLIIFSNIFHLLFSFVAINSNWMMVVFLQALLTILLPDWTPSSTMLKLSWPHQAQLIFQSLLSKWTALLLQPRTESGRMSPSRYPTSFDMLYSYANTSVSLQEAWLNTLITAEIAFWFFVGECIGKGSVVGYKVWTVNVRVLFVDILQ